MLFWHCVNYFSTAKCIFVMLNNVCTVGELKDWTKRHLWSKTTLIASSVRRAGVNPPFCKMGTFFS